MSEPRATTRHRVIRAILAAGSLTAAEIAINLDFLRTADACAVLCQLEKRGKVARVGGFSPTRWTVVIAT